MVTNMIVNNENKAKEAVNRLNETFSDQTFCPLLNGLCNPMCVCFVKAMYYETIHMSNDTDKDKFVIIEGYCDNRMFFKFD